MRAKELSKTPLKSRKRLWSISFDEREIVVALKECSNLKAPGPDGFNFSFVKKGWDFMKSTILYFFREFHANGKLTKALANKIKIHLPSIIGESQAAFIGGKQILDRVLIANEVIHCWKSSNQRGLVLKIDFERAYDYVNWGFLLDLLAKMGFGDKWCRWVKECCSTVVVPLLLRSIRYKE
ncbi:uncharacterized protein LOC131323884 [Rhododendron vialii]|uniref:uncharacterized protein LOC131323884 n=1 Tax=Rhododendron vialii TaxID=182163 RepID=UPI00265F5482|nr:uncharacterized protein LOC131323884 [Rhododendron vialii]